jgi:hypothetical protein
LVATNKIKPLTKEFLAYQGKFLEEAKVNLVVDDLRQIKRPASPYKHIKYENNSYKYSHIVKVASDNPKPQREDFMSLN